MKVADVSEFYSPRGGGVRTYVDGKLRAAARHGVEMVVVAPGPHDAIEEKEGGRIRWIGGPAMPFDPRYHVLHREAAVHAALDAEAPDIVEGSSPWTAGWFAARWRGVAPRTLVFHQDPVAVYGYTLLDRFVSPARIDRLLGAYWSYLRRLASRFDATIVSGEWLERKLTRLGIDNAVAVPFGIDKARFSPQRANSATRRSLLERCGASDGAALLVTIARHHPEKRLGTLIDAFERARRHQPLGLVIYGDGPLRNWVERRASRVPGIHVAGFTRDRDELADALASADVFVHGSSAETFGLVVAEAICSGVPLVVPDAGGAADLAHAGYSELYRAGDAVGCAEAIGRLLARDPAELRRGCAEASTQIDTMDDHFAGLFDFYRTCAT